MDFLFWTFSVFNPFAFLPVYVFVSGYIYLAPLSSPPLSAWSNSRLTLILNACLVLVLVLVFPPFPLILFSPVSYPPLVFMHFYFFSDSTFQMRISFIYHYISYPPRSISRTFLCCSFCFWGKSGFFLFFFWKIWKLMNWFCVGHLILYHLFFRETFEFWVF